MNRITAFTDVEFDEHAAVRRRVNRSFGPAELSVEQQSYNQKLRHPDPESCDNQRMSREIPAAIVLGGVTVIAAVLFGTVAMLAIWK